MPYLLPLPSLDAFWHDSLYWLRTSHGESASDAGMDQWEARTGHALPSTLRMLYAVRNGGVSDWLDAVLGVEGPISLGANFGNHWSGLAAESPRRGASLGEISDGIDFGEQQRSYRHAFGRNADRMWAVASYGSSHYLLLDYRCGAQPAVTLFDDDSRFYGDSGAIRGNDGLYVLAQTFDDFLRNCRRELPHPLRVWSVEGMDSEGVAQRLAERLHAMTQPLGRMTMDDCDHQYGLDHLRLANPYLHEQFQPDFGPVMQYSAGLLGDATLRIHRNLSAQGTRAERFAGDDAVLVSLLLPTTSPMPLPSEASDAIEAVFAKHGSAWQRWLDTDAAAFVAEDDMYSPYIDHPRSGRSLSSARSGAT